MGYVRGMGHLIKAFHSRLLKPIYLRLSIRVSLKLDHKPLYTLVHEVIRAWTHAVRHPTFAAESYAMEGHFITDFECVSI